MRWFNGWMQNLFYLHHYYLIYSRIRPKEMNITCFLIHY